LQQLTITLVPDPADEDNDLSLVLESSSLEEISSAIESVFNQRCVVISVDANESKLIIETAPHQSLQLVDKWHQIIDKLASNFGFVVKLSQVHCPEIK
jgi:hypothetical protein